MTPESPSTSPSPLSKRCVFYNVPVLGPLGPLRGNGHFYRASSCGDVTLPRQTKVVQTPWPSLYEPPHQGIPMSSTRPFPVQAPLVIRALWVLSSSNPDAEGNFSIFSYHHPGSPVFGRARSSLGNSSDDECSRLPPRSPGKI